VAGVGSVTDTVPSPHPFGIDGTLVKVFTDAVTAVVEEACIDLAPAELSVAKQQIAIIATETPDAATTLGNSPSFGGTTVIGIGYALPPIWS
jgi:hypothetical protein